MGGATRTFPDGSVVLLTLLMLALAIVNLGATDAKAVAEGSLGASLEALALGLHMSYEIAVVLCLGRVLGKGHDREAAVLGFAYRNTPGRVISRNPHGFLGRLEDGKELGFSDDRTSEGKGRGRNGKIAARKEHG
jgi:hypothetical protein